jgi:hypothetical protein
MEELVILEAQNGPVMDVVMLVNPPVATPAFSEVGTD